MARRLFTVKDTFMIRGRGLMPVPGVVPQGDEVFRIGDPILLVRPDETTLAWRIGGLGLISGPRAHHDVVLLLVGLEKEAVPVGTEVWSVDPT